MKKKRERLDIVNDILHAIRKNKEIKPTRLLYASNLSPQAFKEYINELIIKKFIKLEVSDEKKMFSITTKGNDFLEQYKKMKNFVDSFGL